MPSGSTKKGVISPFLVQDATFIDLELTHSLSAAVTAFTGLDALTDCIEAHINVNAHPLVDLMRLQPSAFVPPISHLPQTLATLRPVPACP